jgi:hypothetical protein
LVVHIQRVAEIILTYLLRRRTARSVFAEQKLLAAYFEDQTGIIGMPASRLPQQEKLMGAHFWPIARQIAGHV